MDIGSLQVGQNFASQEAIYARQQDELEGQDNVASVVVAQDKQNANVNEQNADNKEELSSANDEQSVESAVQEIQDYIQAQNRQLAFSIDENSKRSVVTVTDSDSGDVIRQIPSEEVLRLSERIRELQSDVGATVGVLFNKQV